MYTEEGWHDLPGEAYMAKRERSVVSLLGALMAIIGTWVADR